MCTITIDVRNPAPESNPHKETGRYNRMEHVLTLMTILSELCGPDTEVFFDFGVVSIRNVDRAEIATRLAARSQDAT